MRFQDREVAARLRMTRLDPQSFAELLDGRGEVVLRHEHVPKVAIRVGQGWIEPQGL